MKILFTTIRLRFKRKFQLIYLSLLQTHKNDSYVLYKNGISFSLNFHFEICIILKMCHKSRLNFVKFRAYLLSAVARRKGRRSHLQGCDLAELFRNLRYSCMIKAVAPSSTKRLCEGRMQSCNVSGHCGKGHLLLRVNKAANLPRLTQLRYFFRYTEYTVVNLQGSTCNM